MVAVVPLIFHGSPYWLGLVAGGMCYAIAFLSFTVVTGEGGMLWLSQIIFAGGGAIAAAQFVTVWHVPVLLAIVLGGIVMAVVGAVIGLLTIRLGDLYVALVTLSFGLLVETLVFTLNRFTQGGLGVTINRPTFASGNLAFSYFALVVFLIFAALIVNLRRSTSGLALRAVRDSEAASRTLGVSVVQVKVIVGALGAFVAGVGGAFLAMDAGVAQPTPSRRSPAWSGSRSWSPWGSGPSPAPPSPDWRSHFCRACSRPTCPLAGRRCRPSCSVSAPSRWPRIPTASWSRPGGSSGSWWRWSGPRLARRPGPSRRLRRRCREVRS